MSILEILTGLLVLTVGVLGLVNAQTGPGGNPLPAPPRQATHRVDRWSFGSFLKPGSMGDLVTIRDLEGVVRSSFLPPSSPHDVGPLKRDLLDPQAGPKVVVLATRPLTADERRRFDRLCSETKAHCAIFLWAKSRGQKLPAFPEESDAANTVPLLGADGARVGTFLFPLREKAALADGPLVAAVFRPSGELLWTAGLDSLEFSTDELGTILRTMSSTQAIEAELHPQPLQPTPPAIAGPAANPALADTTASLQPAPVSSSLQPPHRISLSQLTQTVHALEGGAVSPFAKSYVAHKRSPLLLIFWGSWCAPCVDEMPLLRDLSRKYAGQLTFVGIAFQSSERDLPKVRDMVAKNRIDYPQYVIYNQDLPRAVLGITDDPAYPSFALFDSQGVLRWTLGGASMKAEGSSAKLSSAFEALQNR